ncbi:hypothetical protein [Stenotrophomonas maltophilia]|uniref:hypothetical protein n=1 Tax=Stenotrophomonas maltophilia TaxID=40324 RepID=UPI0015F1C738|nr:hypothetical protein [Stenotrophomonas maltophilia]QDY48751.1 hypothetical protein DUW70_09505 [Stenotrophomonas maltophilia]
MDVEQRAREMLAEEYRTLGIEPQAARLMEQGHQPGGVHYAAVQAIIAALTPPAGFVLVPVEPTEEMQQAGYPADDAQTGYEAMIAARPEVKP